MQADLDERPLIGRTGRTLGVRVPRDIAPDHDGIVHPSRGGMSVAPSSVWNVPNHRRPHEMGRGSTGPSRDRIYSIGDELAVVGLLVVRSDPGAPSRHAFVEPSQAMPLEHYEQALVSTRPAWRQAWP